MIFFGGVAHHDIFFLPVSVFFGKLEAANDLRYLRADGPGFSLRVVYARSQRST